jgi:peptide/nickel transport system permease protein
MSVLAWKFRRLPPALRSGRVLVGGGIVLAVAVIAIFAPWLAPNDPQEMDLFGNLLPPAWDPLGDPKYPFGTDSLGRCILSQLIYGARVAMIVAVVAATGAMVIGVSLALIAGYFGGWIDGLITRLVDLWMSFPPVVLSLILMLGLGIGVSNVILAIILVDWTRFCRVVRSDVLVVRQRDFISAAHLLGFGHFRTIRREVLPSVMPLIITLTALEMGIAVVVEAILSFVGMSVEADISAWGVMVADARQYMYQSVWGMIFPILAITVTVLGFNLLGDGLRRTLDPRLRQQRHSTA